MKRCNAVGGDREPAVITRAGGLTLTNVFPCVTSLLVFLGIRLAAKYDDFDYLIPRKLPSPLSQRAAPQVFGRGSASGHCEGQLQHSVTIGSGSMI